MDIKQRYLLIGILANHGISASKAWQVPSELKARMNEKYNLDITKINSLNLDQVISLFENPLKLHRFNKKIAMYIYNSFEYINEVYDDDMNLLLPIGDNLKLIDNLQKLPGMSKKKAAHYLVYLCAIDSRYVITNEEFELYTKDCEALVNKFDENLSILSKAF